MDSLEEPNRAPLGYIKEWLVDASQKKSQAANAKSLLNAPLEPLVLDAFVGPGVQSVWEQLKKQVGAMPSTPVVDLTRHHQAKTFDSSPGQPASVSRKAEGSGGRQRPTWSPRGSSASEAQGVHPHGGSGSEHQAGSRAKSSHHKTIFNVNLSNGGETTVRGLQKGISPFSFLAKDEEVIEKEKEDQEDFDGADFRTTEDVKNHRKKFALFLPQNGDELVVCLKTYTYAAKKIVGSTCNHLVETKSVKTKIRATGVSSLRVSAGPRRQSAPIRAPLHGDRAWAGHPPRMHAQTALLTTRSTRNMRDCRQHLEESSSVEAEVALEVDFKRETKTTSNDAPNTLLDNLPYLSIVGSARNMCYQHLLGECTSRECRQYRYHATNAELNNDPNFQKTLSEKLKPGVIKLMTDAQGSRKRVWEQT
ncbi:hypothetical protein THAOC_19235 [Thalassiosira oceanica]|uniref:Uncharacterized protein n=1 Tax=Thalassiosira oceanica TaxID=159749 RepID=K0S686_THAOC|nr:hypothetical protein THAOC_19235 [Thalassiosira oceanica]|eukprot:EJK60419.1 hypothetical protein THAOC_19235 [Thalassiosira oceanica]